MDSSLVLVGVRSADSSQSVTGLLPGRVNVLVAEGNIAILVLGLVLRAHHWGGGGLGNRGSSVGNGWGGGSLGDDGSLGGNRGNWGGNVGGNHWGGGWSGSRERVEGGDGSSVGKLGVNQGGASIGSRVGESSIPSIGGVEAGTSQELSLTRGQSEESGDYSL